MISRRRAARPAILRRPRTKSGAAHKRPLPDHTGTSSLSGQGPVISPPPPFRLPVRVVVRKRLPAFWRGVDDAATGTPTTPERLRLWRLVCTALRIPSKQVGNRLLVPALYETLARKHLAEVATEGRLPPAPPPPARHNAHLALLFLSTLLIWFGVTHKWWVSWPDMTPENWNALGALDVYRTLHGQWYRVVTALTLHSNSEHLFSNLLFGAPFFVLLCRRIGVGPGITLAVLSGSLGNLGNVLYRVIRHSPGFVSLGFSTALFGIVGALSGVMAAHEILHALANRSSRLFPGLRRAGVLLAAGVAVLAMLGSDPSARTDYAAHIFGLIAGILCGLGYGFVQAGVSRRVEYAMGGCAGLLVLLAWGVPLIFFAQK